MALLDELSQPHPYKTVVLDAYSSVEEDVVRFLEKAKGKQANLWRYRALYGGFYIFKHEYVMVFQKP